MLTSFLPGVNVAPVAPVAPIIQQPVAQPAVHFFFNAKDPKLGWLCWDYPSPFVACSSGDKYFSIFHYIAAKMAVISGDMDAAMKIANVPFPSVGPFEQAVIDRIHSEIGSHLVALGPRLNMQAWEAQAEWIFQRSIAYKFCQNRQLFDWLLATGKDYLIETSMNRVNGIGYEEATVRAGQAPIESWGKNLHGVTLMQIRDELRAMGWESRPQWSYVPPAPGTGVPSNGKESVVPLTDLTSLVAQLNNPVLAPAVEVKVEVPVSLPVAEVPVAAEPVVEEPKPVEVPVEAPKVEEPVAEVVQEQTVAEPAVEVVAPEVEEPKPVEAPSALENMFGFNQ